MLRKIPVSAIIFISVFFLYSPALSADAPDPDLYKEPSLQINIPTVQFSQIKTEGEYIRVPHLAEYVAGVYKYAVSIISIVAVVMIMAGGLFYLTSGGSAERVGRAKEMISGAAIGLILALGSYLVLYTLNPNLVGFEALKIKSIARQELSITDYSDESYYTSTLGTSSTGLANIKGDNMLRVGGQAISDLVTKFQQAASALKNKNCIIASASGARSGTNQITLTKSYCKWSQEYSTYVNCTVAVGPWGSTVSTPKSSTCKYANPDKPLGKCDVEWVHEKAIDAFAVELNTKKSSAGGLRCYGRQGCMTERCQLELIREMNSAGACVLLGRNQNPSEAVFEPWHFELAGSGNGAYCYTNGADIIESLK